MTVLPQQLLTAVNVNDSLSFAFPCVCPRSLAGPVPSRCVATNQGHIRSHFSGGRSAGVRYDKLSNNNGTNREMFTTVYDAFSKDDVAQLSHLKS